LASKFTSSLPRPDQLQPFETFPIAVIEFLHTLCVCTRGFINTQRY
jgi:hypothetical protein